MPSPALLRTLSLPVIEIWERGLGGEGIHIPDLQNNLLGAYRLAEEDGPQLVEQLG